MMADQRQKKEIRHLEQELPKWQILVENVTGDAFYDRLKDNLQSMAPFESALDIIRKSLQSRIVIPHCQIQLSVGFSVMQRGVREHVGYEFWLKMWREVKQVLQMIGISSFHRGVAGCCLSRVFMKWLYTALTVFVDFDTLFFWFRNQSSRVWWLNFGRHPRSSCQISYAFKGGNLFWNQISNIG